MIKEDMIPKLYPGDYVRISISEKDNPFKKSYKQNWSNDIYYLWGISNATMLHKSTYTLYDINKKSGIPTTKIDKKFQRSELLKIESYKPRINLPGKSNINLPSNNSLGVRKRTATNRLNL